MSQQPKIKVTYKGGQRPSEDEVNRIAGLVNQVLHMPALTGLHPADVLNVLFSAYWTAANSRGQADVAAQNMVEIGTRHLLSQAAAAAHNARPAGPLH